MLKINEKYRIIDTDQWSYELQEFREGKNPKTKEPVQNWKCIGWFPKVSQALSKVLNCYMNELIAKDEYDCKALIDKLTEIEKDLEKVDVIHPSKFATIKKANQKGKTKKTTQEEEDPDAI